MDAEDEGATFLKQSGMRHKKFNKTEKKNTNNGLEVIHLDHIAKDKNKKGHKVFEEGHFIKRRKSTEAFEKKKKKTKKVLEGSADNDRRIGEEVGGCCVSQVKMKKRKRNVKHNVDEIKNTFDLNSENNAHSLETKMMQSDIGKKEKLADECSEDSIGMAMKKNKKKKKKENKRKRNDVCADLDDIQTKSLGTSENESIIKEKMGECDPQDANPRKNKRVRFVDELEVCPVVSVPEKVKGKNKEVDELVQGKRFSKVEDEIIKEAVSKYIEKHELGDDGLNMVLNCKSLPNLKGCWKQIGSALPHRPYRAVYNRAQKMFRKSEIPWTEEEYEFVKKYHEKHGNRWADMAEELGKYRTHIFNAWLRRIRLPNLKKGRWSQEEYQTLFDLVNIDLQLKVSEEKKSRHGMLRDNICWIAISDKLASRNNTRCCDKWYRHLTSPLVAEGKWADSDDYRLVGALYELDGSCIENVDWDNILEHRSGEVTLKRWKQMVRHISNHENKPFAEQVEILAKRYCPYLLEARVAWDSKPYVQ
ncbi:unnamed protein product [Cuscuta europaea]|uniref:Uncharacterized protein n=1 Tax=Cuscuta europaea TaxID=41803 RepID=A0A9P1ECJ0_CUSEU|nr:unnamed protein product [Cuscuta europaea]